MDVFDLHPRDERGRPVYVVPSFTDAYELHHAATIVYTMQNRRPPGVSPEGLKQRAAIFTLVANLLVDQRNKCLDDFCTHWLKHRHLPIPTYEPQSNMDLPGPAAPDASVQGAVRNESSGS